MQSRRPQILIPLAIAFSLISYAVGPRTAQQAEARHLFESAGALRGSAAAQFVAAAAHIGSLRGLDKRALLRATSGTQRFSEYQTGQSADGGVVSVNNWVLSPAGNQSVLGDLPVRATLSPDGRHMLVVNSGAGVQSVQIIDTSNGGVVQNIPYASPHSAFIGAAYSPDGKSAYVSGGGENTVHTFSASSDGTLTGTGDVTEAPAVAPFTQLSKSSYPSGLSVSNDGKTVYVANSNANNVAVIDASARTVTSTIAVGYAPYTTAVDPRSGLVYVSNWGDATISVIDPKRVAVVSTISVGNHPTAMAFGPANTLYVSDSNSDAVSIVNTQTKTEVGRVPVTGEPNRPLSSSPQGLAVSPDGRFLYVALAGDNALAVFTLSFDGRSTHFQGWIPTAWYPTDVAVSPDSSKIFVTNGFGMGEHPNNGPLRPDPTRPTPSTPLIQQPGYCSCSLDQFSGTMDVGTLSTVDVPTRGQLTNDTLQVARNDHFFDLSPVDRSQDNPVPLPGQPSPIKHVIYIVKENRTYDQVLGDEPAGKGDASLTLFPKSVTPNIHALAERFGILDNFYADAQVSADGHNWTLSANANDYAEKLWPQDYSSPGRSFGYPFEGGTAMPLSPGGYLWDAAARAGVTYRDYGLYANFDVPTSAKIQPESQSCDGPVTHTYVGTTIPAGNVLCFLPTTVNAATTPNLVGHIDPKFINYDLRYPDMERVTEWKREFNDFVSGGNLPALEFVRLSSDHTAGTTAGQWSPQRFASDNDAAVGQLVDTVSHSPYWASTAIFVVEDDAQNGPDHIDSHRTEALVISPYTSQSSPHAESTHYDTSAMVRTIELILGLKPLSQYDATAMPMWHLFGSQPDSAPYTAAPQAVTTGTVPPHAYGEKVSARMNFALPDQAWTPALNRILWHYIKGARVPFPGTDPYGIPAPQDTHYVWGALAGRTYGLLNVHGAPMVHIVSSGNGATGHVRQGAARHL